MNKENLKISAFFARVEGRVQGVGFRYSCRNEGQRLGLLGWVRNMPNGDVEVWAEGTEENLQAMLEWLRRGPPGARVNAVHCEKRSPTGEYKDFGVAH